jgi:hypothetical protein
VKETNAYTPKPVSKLFWRKQLNGPIRLIYHFFAFRSRVKNHIDGFGVYALVSFKSNLLKAHQNDSYLSQKKCSLFDQVTDSR